MVQRKVISFGTVAAGIGIVVWAVNSYTPVQVPPEIQGLLTTFVGGMIAYFTNEPSTTPDWAKPPIPPP